MGAHFWNHRGSDAGVLKKALFYTGIFVIIYLPTQIIQLVNIDWIYISMIFNVLISSQGILNAMIFSSQLQGCCCCSSSQLSIAEGVDKKQTSTSLCIPRE